MIKSLVAATALIALPSTASSSTEEDGAFPSMLVTKLDPMGFGGTCHFTAGRGDEKEFSFRLERAQEPRTESILCPQSGPNKSFLSEYSGRPRHLSQYRADCCKPLDYLSPVKDFNFEGPTPEGTGVDPIGTIDARYYSPQVRNGKAESSMKNACMMVRGILKDIYGSYDGMCDEFRRRGDAAVRAVLEAVENGDWIEYEENQG
ncbi:hypothetical protein FOZ63_008422, partial [Perkinsus olseni]